MASTVDLAILGGGCAGLALGRELAKRETGMSVVILEQRTAYEEDRTWCFWAKHDEIPDLEPAARWRSWLISAGEQRVLHSGEAWSYQMVRADHYYAQALYAIRMAPTIELRLGVWTESFEERDGFVDIATRKGHVRARWVIDTRPPQKLHLQTALLAQVFAGAEVEVGQDLFDSTTACVMGNMQADAGGMSFDYVLPISPRRALIEYTLFTAQPPEPAQLESYCDQRIAEICRKPCRILRREHGWLPLGLPELPLHIGPVFLAGVRGGALRASSGFGFRRIQTWARACADELLSGRGPIKHAPEPALRAVMDRLFLTTVASNPTAAADYFLSAAAAFKGDDFARFMSDSASPSDWLRLVAALPKRTFLVEAFRMSAGPTYKALLR